MKIIFSLCVTVAGFSVYAQNSENVFDEAFSGMFDIEDLVYIPASTPPAPPVPLDGGLVALLTAGGAVAYRKLRTKK